MLFVLLISISQAIKTIYVCNGECHSLCSSDSYIAKSSDNEFKNYLLSHLKDEKEIEIDFYSKSEKFEFQIDSTYFGDTRVILKTLADSQSIKLNIKEGSQPFYKIVEVKPNYQVVLPNLTPILVTKDKQKKNTLDSPIITPIPISVGIHQMTVTGDFSCTPDKNKMGDLNNIGCNTENLESDAASKCGFRCWTSQASFSYTFKGVKFGIYGTLDPNHRKFDVELDGKIIQEIDEKTNDRKEYQLIFTSELLRYGEHTIRAVSKGETFEIYKFVYWPSLKARRLNSTDFNKTSGTWKKETDGIGGVREYTENSGGTATLQMKCSKFWIYGVTDNYFASISLTFGDLTESVSTYSDNREQGAFLYESSGLEDVENTLTLSGSGIWMLYCIYYEDPSMRTETPYPTKTLAPPTQSPIPPPVITPVPISIGLTQMNAQGINGCHPRSLDVNQIQNLNCDTEDLNSANAYQCGFQCWGPSTYTYTFKGVKFALYGTNDPKHGVFNIWLNDTNIAEINQMTTERQNFSLLYESATLDYGEHTVKTTGKTKVYQLYKLVFWPSLKAKRLNSTDFTKGGTWKKESDGIGGVREYTNNQDATATATIRCSKVWIYGSTASHHGSMTLQLGEITEDINENTNSRADAALIYETDDFPLKNRQVTFTSKGTVMIYCLYYIDEAPEQTQAPHPSRTMSPISSDSYIDKIFTYNLPNFQIHVTQDSVTSQISGCQFNQIKEDFDYFIRLEKEVSFFSNTFYYEPDQSEAPAPIEILYNGRLTIKCCKFENSKSRINNGNVFYCSRQYSMVSIFESCEFINCGDSSVQMIIKNENSGSTINMTDCSVKFNNDDRSCKVIEASCSNIIINKCRFEKVGTINVNLMSTRGVFRYTDNIANQITKQFIFARNIRTRPIITGNVFQNVQVNNVYFLNFFHDQDQFEMINNTFSKIISTSSIEGTNSKLYGGGISLWIQKGEYTRGDISFRQCIFEDNENRHTDSILAQGGAFQIGYSSSIANISLEFDDCQFKRNKCLNGKGGALGININHDITINNCIFEDNTAAHEGGAIYIWGKIVKPEEQQAPDLPDSLQMDSVTIIDCTFNGNQASNAAGIYTEEDNIQILSLNISSCTFNIKSNEQNADESNLKGVIVTHIPQIYLKGIDFNFEQKSSNIRPIVCNSQQLSFTNSIYEDITTNDDYLFIFDSDIVISNFSFLNCYSASYLIKFTASRLTITDSIFQITNSQPSSSTSCGAILITNANSQTTITHSKIASTYSNGAIKTNDPVNSLSIEFCTFQACYGQESKYFDIKYSNEFIFKHNILSQAFTQGGSNGKITPPSSVKEFLFENITFTGGRYYTQYSSDFGIQFEGLSKITFSNCKWTKNNPEYFPNNDIQNFNLDAEFIYQTCTFNENEILTSSDQNTNGGALTIKNSKVTFQSCTFTNNKSPQRKGGAIFCNPNDDDQVITIKSCTFSGNVGNDGASIYSHGSNTKLIISDTTFTSEGVHYIIVLENSNLEISQTTFTNTNSHPIRFENVADNTVQNIFFDNVKSNNSPLLFVENDLSFINLTFDNCISANYVITCQSNNIMIADTLIQFNEAQSGKSCGGVYLYKSGNYVIRNTQFIRTFSNSVISYESSTVNGQLEISGCIFDSFNNGAGRCLLLTNVRHPITFYNNSIMNDVDATYSGLITFIGVGEFTLESCNFSGNSFTNNAANNDYCGGCGLWINSNEAYSDNALRPKLSITFSSCQWINNYCSKNSGGGAIQVGNSKSYSNNELIFTKCIFEGNRAKIGGAISISTCQPVQISECLFKNNEAEVKGGAIYIKPFYFNGNNNKYYIESISITRCSFEGNKAATDGHFAYIEGGNEADKTTLIIDDSNTFVGNKNQNGQGNAILYQGKGYILQLNFVDYSCESVRLIEFAANSTGTISNSVFQNCQTNGDEGQVIKVDSDSFSFTLIDSSFIDCGSSGFIVKDFGGISSFINTKFEFTSTTTSCCALDITTKEEVNVEGCSFIQTNNVNQNSGSLFYHPETSAILSITDCIFDGCTGKAFSSFYVITSNEITLAHNVINNTGSNENPSDYTCGLDLSTVESLEINNCSFSNIVSTSEYGGGCGFLIRRLGVTQPELTFHFCKWNDNCAKYSKDIGSNRHNGIGGAYQIGFDGTSSNTLLKFEKCTFRRNKADYEGGALAIQTKKRVNVLGCIFEDNRAGFKPKSSNANLLDDIENMGCGGAIYIDPDYSNEESEKMPLFEISSTNFSRNIADNGHGVYIRGGGSTSLSVNNNCVFDDNGKNGTIILSECDDLDISGDTVFTFTNESDTTRPRPFDIAGNSNANFENLLIENSLPSSNPNEGNSLHFNSNVNQAVIRNCTFRNCGNSGYVITFYCRVEFINSKIIFDDPQNACKGLGIFTSQIVRITNSSFTRSNNYDETNLGGGIYVDCTNNNTLNDLRLNNVTFDENYGTNNRCFRIAWPNSFCFAESVHIINSPLSGHTGAFYFKLSSSGLFVFNNWEFINNTANSLFGGGCGIWVADIDKKNKLELTFENCVWNENHAVLSHTLDDADVDGRKFYNGLGGAFQQGFSQSNANTKLKFSHCSFENNTADSEGGALAIQTLDDCTIQHCLFKNNKAGQSTDYDKAINYGGAIFIDPDFNNDFVADTRRPTTIIENCTFELNTAKNEGHAISLSGTDAKVNILNATFINNGDNSGSALYSICPKLEFENVKFIRTDDNQPSTRAIRLDVFGEVTLHDVLFNNCKSLQSDGGAIFLNKPFETTSNVERAVTEQVYNIENCTFINCHAKNGGSIFIAEGVNSVSILDTVFEGGSVDTEGVAIYISKNVAEFNIDSSVKFIKQNDNGKFLISSSCTAFNIRDLEIQNGQFGTGVKGIVLNAGTVSINNVFFNKCTSALEIAAAVQQATINRCIFSDCYSGTGTDNQGNGQVVLVSNTRCTFSNNIINFSNNIQAITGMYFRSHGYINIENNKFINLRPSTKRSPRFTMQSIIQFDETQTSSVNDATFRFNNNLIQNIGLADNSQFPFLYIDKKLQFNIDHNTFKDCTSGGYSMQIIVGSSALEMAQTLVLVNLTFQNCVSKSMTGGSTGLWLLFKNKEGSLTLRDCVFNGCKSLHKINDKNQDEGGHGGGFGMGLTSIDKMQITIDNCSFINNMAEWYGGGLYLRTSRPAEIINSEFKENQAELGGGALYINPDSTTGKMPNCEIHGCKFERNIDNSLKNGHAIQFQQTSNAEIIFTIDQNCEFKDNGDIGGEYSQNNLLGYTIVSQVHSLVLKDSRIVFSNIHMTTAALNISGVGETTVTNMYFKHVNSGLWHNQNPDFPAHAIYISSKPSEVEINHCNFDYCGGIGSKTTIVDNGKTTTINDCNFINDNNGESRVGALKVTSAGTHTITNCQINNAWGDKGAFIYIPQEVTNSQRKFTFANISIDKCFGDAKGDNTNIALNFKFEKADELDMYNVEIKNTEFDGAPLVGIELADDMKEFTLDNFKFISNTIKHTAGGGSGMWIHNQNSEVNVTLVNCLFEGNKAVDDKDINSRAGYGGAWMVGNDNATRSLTLVFESCEFKSNIAENGGGALFISTAVPVTIRDCKFEGNSAVGNGGAILIDESIRSEDYQITGCTFKNNLGNWGTTISIKSPEGTLVDINDCTFVENVKNRNIIYSYGKDVVIHDMKFEYQSFNENARPFCAGEGSNTEIYNIQFIKCCSMNDNEGSSIRAESNANSLNIHECLFENGKDVGSSVHILCSSLTVKNCDFRCTDEYRQAGLHIDNARGKIEVIGCTFSHLKRTGNNISPLHVFSNTGDIDFTFEDLVFSDCSGNNLRCFSISALKPFTFENVTVRDNKLGNYLGEINLRGFATRDHEFIFKNCKWISNALNSDFGGGSGLWLVNGGRETYFSFDGCLFEGNSHTKHGGGFQDGKTGTTFSKYLEFRGCTFNNNKAGEKGGALAVQTVLPFTIDRCTFNNNEAVSGGGAIFIETTQSKKGANNNQTADYGTIKNCVFNNCSTPSGKGTIICIENSTHTDITISGTNKVTNNGERGSIIYSQCKNLIVNDLTFDFISVNNLAKNFRAALLAPEGSATFNNCKFTGTGFTTNSPNGHAILAEKYVESVIFDECTFTDCGDKSGEYAIFSTAFDLQFIGSTIKYTNPLHSSGGIHCTDFCKLTVTDSLFKDIYANNTENGGGISYNPRKNGVVAKCDVTLSGTTFDNIMSRNGRAAFFKLGKYPRISNCTFKNMPVGSYILTIGHEIKETGQITLENLVFMDNEAKVSDNSGGGGCGLWVSQADRCLFDNCKFIRNVNRKECNGGVIGYEPSGSSNSKVTLQFRECYFEDNKVQQGFNGGALYINARIKPVFIESCVFSNTIDNAAYYGGALYIDGATTQPITIVDTKFNNMKANSNENTNGNAIYIDDETTADIRIESCTFTDCGTFGSVLASSGKHVYFSLSTITFTSRTSACKGINVKYRTHFEFTDSIIKNCYSPTTGGAISYRLGSEFNKGISPLEANYSENLVFRNLTIDSCESRENNGRAIYLTATSSKVSFFNLTIQHITSNTGFIFTMGHTSKIPDAVRFEKCNFIDCSTDIKDGDGGGLGFWCSDEDEIRFEECLFQQLSTPKNGGALSFTQSIPRRTTKLTFVNCFFDQNTATNGSALYIDITAQLHILECNFTFNTNENLNKAGGGCIFITKNCRNINIESTEFHQNTQTSTASTGNAIYFENQNELVGCVNDCKFINCGTKGSVVYSDGVDLDFFGNTISFTNEGQGCKGLHVPKSCNIHVANSSFIGCVNTANNDGAGFVYNSQNDLSDPGLITLENSIFENNNATNGCALRIITNANPIIKDLTIRKHNNGNFICSIFFTKAFDEEVVIDGCTFEDNSFTTKNQNSPDGGGAGIWVAQLQASTTPVTFSGCTFKNNYASMYGGAMAFGYSGTLEQVLLTYQKCSFVDNVAGNDGGALWIDTLSLFVIDDCEFISNTVNSANGKGNAIILKEKTTSIITDTTIVNNGKRGSAIVFEGKVFNALDTTVEFDLVNESCRGIEFRNKGTIELEGCTFLRCNAYNDNTENCEGGGILFHEAITNNLELIFSLDSCIFDGNDALNGSALLLNISTAPEIYGCTFRNHQSGSFIFSIVFSMFQMVYEFTDCVFENNYHAATQDHEDGGGSGIWIANNKQIAAGRLMQVYFTGVKFINNVSPSVGGAFAYGRSPTVYPTELYFDSCQFDGNTAETDGGALWIITKSPYEIQYCNFKNNVANKHGGSIMVDTEAPIATIQTSTFEMDTAEVDGNSIYVSDKTPRFILSGNNFVDCGLDKNVITIDTTIAGIDGNTIQFSDELETCRGINLKSAGTYEITDNTFKLCKADQGGGLKYDNVNNKEGVENLIISGNTFDSCIATSSGCAMYLRVNEDPTFENNDINNCKYGTKIVHISFIKEITEYVLDGFVFKNNEVHNSQGDEDSGGSGFLVDNLNHASFDYKFKAITWLDNTASYAGGAFGFGRGSATRHNNLYFESCTFVNNRCKEQLGGALWIATTGIVSIENSNFTNNKALGTDSKGGAIYFDPLCTASISIVNTHMSKNSAIDANAIYLPSSLSSVHIDGCDIRNNGNLNSAISSICPILLIENTFIGFEKYSLKCRGISILTSCNFTVKNCNISNCDANEGRDQGGGIYFNHEGASSRSIKAAQESIVIEDCIFTNCKGGNGCACMIWSSGNVVFNRNTIQDCRNGKFIFVIICSNFVENFVIEDCIFHHNLMNNKQNNEDGGGSGIWVANNKDKVPQGSYTHLTFRNCQWTSNQASTVGGAFAWGRSDTIINTAVTFDNCRFINNNAKNREGGALWICTSVPFLVENCYFEKNKAKGDSPMGGAISVAAKAPQINIKNTKFNENEAREGNAIYVHQTTNDMNITDCTFQDNGIYGSVIANEAKGICLDTSYIQFESTSKSCRGISFLSKSTVLLRDTHFINCKTTESVGGGGFYYKNTLEADCEESFTIDSCLFNGCEGPNGCAFLAWLESPIILRNTLIWHSTNGRYIVSVFYNKYVNETIIEDCYFEHNYHFNDDFSRDGGGSGLWFANARDLVPDTEIKKLTFIGCTWRDNRADGYGGALSFGQSPTLNGNLLEMRDCIFINNTASKSYGGALHVENSKELLITDCFFDGNMAGGVGGALYIDKEVGETYIRDCKFARNKAHEAGAIYIKGSSSKIDANSLIFSENKADLNSPSMLILHSGNAPINFINCKYDFTKIIGQTQIIIQNFNDRNSEETINFIGCCFTHQGDIIDETVTHVKINLVSGTINFGSGNCFDTEESLAITMTNESSQFIEISGGEEIFNCHTCTVPSIPTSPPTNMPTQSPSPTPEATPRATDQLPDPTPRPTVDQPSTSAPSRSPAKTVTPMATEKPTPAQPTQPQSGVKTSTPTRSTVIDTGNAVSRGKSNSQKIGIIAGITIAIVAVIVTIIVLVWFFLFKRRNLDNVNDSGYRQNTIDNETNQAIDSTPGTDDPIWSYQSQENPMYDDNNNDDGNDDNAFADNNNFEESWGS